MASVKNAEKKKITVTKKANMEVVIDDSLSRFLNKGYFQEKIDKGNEMLFKYGLPNDIIKGSVETTKWEISRLTKHINTLREELQAKNERLSSNKELRRMTAKRRRIMAHLKENYPKQYNTLAKKISLSK